MAIPDTQFNFYAGVVLADKRIRGRETIATLLAIGAAESGLDNLAIGNNAKNGTPETSPAYFYCGWGWLQHDEYWLLQDWIVNKVVYDLIALRRDPAYSVDLLSRRPGLILFQGGAQTYINFTRWATYPKKSDSFMPQALAAVDRVMAL